MSAFLASQREAAERAGITLADVLPTARDEAWRYTALRSVDRAHAPDAQAATREMPVGLAAFVDAPVRLVFLNGAFRAEFSTTDMPQGVRVEHAVASDGANDGADVFSQMAATIGTQTSIHVDAGAKIESPIALIFVGAAEQQPFVAHVRARLNVGAFAHATFIVQYLGGSMSNMLTNAQVDLSVAKGATVELIRIQSTGTGSTVIERTRAELGEQATLAHWSLDAGADLARQAIDVRLMGREARFTSRGAFLVAGRQHSDTQLSVDHVARDTSCDLRWRGIADQRARGVFAGNIRVHPGADGTDAQLSNKNLLLSPHAEIDTKPVLEILADEVKASHGATVGELDDTALFYLRSRGVPLDEARAILTQAFVRALFADVPAAAETIERRLERRSLA